MSAYMGEWYSFEGRMLDHFNARHTEAAKFGVGIPSTQATRLLEARGEPEGGGIREYLFNLGQDKRVSECWSMAREKHERCVGEFVTCKDRVAREGWAK